MKNIKKNYLYNLSYQILLVIAPLITTPYISRILGVKGIGVYSYVVSIVQYFVTVAVWGSALYGQREIAYVQNSVWERSREFWSIFIFRFMTAFLSYISFLMVSYKLESNKYLYFVVSVNIINIAFDITWFFQGLEEFGRIALKNFIFKVINIILIFIFIKQEEDLIFYALIVCGSTFIGNLSLWLQIPQFIKLVSIKDIHIIDRIPIITSLFIPTVAIQIYTILDKSMIGIITKDYSQNGCYEQAERIAKMTLTIITSLGNVMFPRIGLYFSQNDKKNLQRAMYESYQFVWCLGVPLALGVIGIADNVIPWFLGEGYELSIPMLKIFSVLILAIGFSNVTGIQYLIPIKKQKLFTKTVSVGAIVNLTMNLLLIPPIGAVGAAIASVTAEVVIAVLLLNYIKGEFSIKRIAIMGKNYIFAGTLMYIVLRVENRCMVASVANSVLMIITGVTIYILVLVLIKDEFYLHNAIGLLDKIKKGGAKKE